MKSLQSMDQHRPVGFLEHVTTDLNLVVWTDGDQVRVERGVVKRAEGNAVGHRWRAENLAIANDVGGFQERLMLQPTDSAVALIGFEDAFTEFLLVEPLLDGSCDVPPTDVSFNRIICHIAERGKTPFIDTDRERQGLWGIADDEHRIFGFVPSLNDAVKVDQRHSPHHGFSKPHVVWMTGIAPAIAVPEQAVVANSVVVRSRLAFLGRNRGDAQWKATDPRLEYALRRLQWHAIAIKSEAALKQTPIEQVG
jgi:hypothetical protein